MKASLLNPLLALVIGWHMARAARAEFLVITEVMSSGSQLYDGLPGQSGPDFWELTNYGIDEAHLDGYRFNDNTGGLAQADADPFRNLVIQPGRSLVFAQQPDSPTGGPSTYTSEMFRALWGLPRSVPVIFYRNNGLASARGEELWLWRPNPDEPGKYELVDFVQLPDATVGRSFTFDPATGLFGAISTVGIDGAFAAKGSDDVGSPGLPPAPIPLAFRSQPANVSANPGDSVVLRTEFIGLPKPICRWFRNGSPFPVGVGSELVISSVQAFDAGRYQAVLDNGFEVLASTPCIVTLQQKATPPVWVETLADQELFPGQSVTFRAMATGLPQPSYQWWHGDTRMDGMESPQLVLTSVGESEAGVYTLVASNTSGSVTNRATLRIVPRPKLAITEAMAGQSPNTNNLSKQDWWELTNFDTFPVDLKGYRFDDESITSRPSLRTAWTLPYSVVIEPGESVIFVEDLTPEQFRLWWGPENLPPQLKIITYHHTALSLSNTAGDTIWLWNPGATSDTDYVVAESFVASPPGRSFGWDPVEKRFWGTRDHLMVDGVQGVFQSADGNDFGSPGFVISQPVVITKTVLEKHGVRLHWKSELGKAYRVLSAPQVEGSQWKPISEVKLAEGGRMDQWIPLGEGLGMQFFRVFAE